MAVGFHKSCNVIALISMKWIAMKIFQEENASIALSIIIEAKF